MGQTVKHSAINQKLGGSDQPSCSLEERLLLRVHSLEDAVERSSALTHTGVPLVGVNSTAAGTSRLSPVGTKPWPFRGAGHCSATWDSQPGLTARTEQSQSRKPRGSAPKPQGLPMPAGSRAPSPSPSPSQHSAPLCPFSPLPKSSHTAPELHPSFSLLLPPPTSALPVLPSAS